MSEEWGPWIEHTGGGNPVPGQMVAVDFRLAEWRAIASPKRDANPDCDHSENWVWHHDGDFDDIIRYRVRKLRGLTILEGLLENLPEKVDA